MEYYYIIIVGVLFLLAISDIIVGVSNDAVNFLNSAIGSKAAPFKIIILVASLGVIIGATFSNGMMEVARKGIFNPDMFFFNEIMIIFLAVMLTDIILLDFFNTFGLPTSTTVSIVFELLGASVGISAIKIYKASEGLGGLATYINSDRALGIISGIFISILVAFTVGAIIQWIIRLLFTFRIAKTIKYWGGLWGGLSFAVIVYFLLVKGAKGASFISDDTIAYIQNNSFRLILYSAIGSSILFQFLIMFTRVNIFKIVVLLGTFALAMAFAGNDLVNFVGVPLAGYESFRAFLASGQEANHMLMEILTHPVKTPTMFLLIAGLIMAFTLRFSKKARSVTATTIDLSRQDDGAERFESSALARFMVRWSLEFGLFFEKIIPGKLQKMIDARFDQSVLKNKERKQQDILAFDLVRASVNLVVASILISFATSLKLPLSTTYVTFMVAMGSSFSDRSWGRESAVYRITGVLTVIGGWFLTAFIALTVSFLVACAIYFGGMIVIFIFIGIAILLILRSHSMFRKREVDNEKQSGAAIEQISGDNILEVCTETVKSIVINISKLYFLTIVNFTKEKRKDLAKTKKEVKDLNDETKALKKNLFKTIRKLEEDEIESGHYYVQVLDYVREATNSLSFIVNPAFNHVDNNHSPLPKDQSEELLKFNEKMSVFFNYSLNILKSNKFEDLPELIKLRNDIVSNTVTLKKHQIQYLKKQGKGTKVSLVFMEIMTESKNMALFVTNVIESQKQFVEHSKKKK
ncbi:MAG: inorganic phosphate transporter [Bacteroidales bacterium]|nr:inorganic phosphate transporter [Bacteroidales bacterium]MCB8998970.1 inorganic phosphate transporter [Bacteroidales bacterium]MCB9013743.1 inorganic phosphate transporter [Bacteroidales bacterium]